MGVLVLMKSSSVSSTAAVDGLNQSKIKSSPATDKSTEQQVKILSSLVSDCEARHQDAEQHLSIAQAAANLARKELDEARSQLAEANVNSCRLSCANAAACYLKLGNLDECNLDECMRAC